MFGGFNNAIINQALFGSSSDTSSQLAALAILSGSSSSGSSSSLGIITPFGDELRVRQMPARYAVVETATSHNINSGTTDAILAGRCICRSDLTGKVTIGLNKVSGSPRNIAAFEAFAQVLQVDQPNVRAILAGPRGPDGYNLGITCADAKLAQYRQAIIVAYSQLLAIHGIPAA